MLAAASAALVLALTGCPGNGGGSPRVLDAPVGLGIAGTVLSWNAVGGAGGYRVYSGVGANQISGTIAAASFDLTTATPALGVGTWHIRVRAIGVQGRSENSVLSDPVEFTVYHPDIPLYHIEVDLPGGGLLLSPLDLGYGVVGIATVSRTVTLTNTGQRPIGALRLSVTNAAAFDVAFRDLPPEFAPGESATISVSPRAGLPADLHTATVTVSGPEGSAAEPRDFSVGFEVTSATAPPADPGRGTVAQQLAALRGRDPLPTSVWIHTLDPVETIAPESLTFATPVAIHLTRGAPGHALQLAGPGSMFTVGANASLVLADVELRGLADNNHALVTVNGGTLTMRAGARLTGNTNRGGEFREGGAVRIAAGAFAMQGGTIDLNGAEFGGGVSNLRGSVFSMSGGEITRNEAVSGAGVENEGVFDMRGGRIHFNDANFTNGNGGGVTTWLGGVFSMYDGATIDGNRARAGGGGVIVREGGAFEMFGGTIASNYVSHFEGNGGGVMVTGANSLFTMHDGIITDNMAEQAGGGVANWAGGAFRMNGGAIVGNEAGVTGGGLVTLGAGWATMRGGRISGNFLEDGGGGGVDVNVGGTFVMDSGIIHGSNGGQLRNIAGSGATIRTEAANSRSEVGRLDANHQLVGTGIPFPADGTFSLTTEAAEGVLVIPGNSTTITVSGVPAEYVGQGYVADLLMFLNDGFHFHDSAYLTGNSPVFNRPLSAGGWLFVIEIWDVSGGSDIFVAAYIAEATITAGPSTVPFGTFVAATSGAGELRVSGRTLPAEASAPRELSEGPSLRAKGTRR